MQQKIEKNSEKYENKLLTSQWLLEDLFVNLKEFELLYKDLVQSSQWQEPDEST